MIDSVKPPRKKVLPDIVTLAELQPLINGARERRYQTFILTAYSMGLRLGETLNLQVADIDGQRRKVHIRPGKGRKDRFVTLPMASLLALRAYGLTHRHPRLLVPAGKTATVGHSSSIVIDRSGLQKAVKAIAKDGRISKPITIHSLRHSDAAHLVETGVNLPAIQQEMGHECPNTTALSTQWTPVTQQHTDRLINRMVNRLDRSFVGEAHHRTG